MGLKKLGELKERRKFTEEEMAAGRAKIHEWQRNNLSMKEKKFVVEFIKSGGNMSAAARAAYNVGPGSSASVVGATVKKRPKVQREITKLMDKLELTDDYALSSLKEIVDAGKKNLADATATDSLRGLKMILEVKKLLGKSEAPSNDPVAAYQNKSMVDIEAELKKLDEQQQRILKLAGAFKKEAEEGEVVNEA